MKKKIEDYKAEIKCVNAKLIQEGRRRFIAESELGHYQHYFWDKFRFYVETSAENKYPIMTALILGHVKFFNKRRPFDFNQLPLAV